MTGLQQSFLNYYYYINLLAKGKLIIKDLSFCSIKYIKYRSDDVTETKFKNKNLSQLSPEKSPIPIS